MSACANPECDRDVRVAGYCCVCCHVLATHGLPVRDTHSDRCDARYAALNAKARGVHPAHPHPAMTREPRL